MPDSDTATSYLDCWAAVPVHLLLRAALQAASKRRYCENDGSCVCTKVLNVVHGRVDYRNFSPLIR